MECIKKFLLDESGATAVEYGIVVALIAGAIILALTALGGNLGSLFDSMAGKVKPVGGG
jgi:pilus assembly protein Flp/PilA